MERISCIHPEAEALRKRNSRFFIYNRSVFEHSSGLDVLRTTNILNKAYFRTEKLAEGVNAAFQSLIPGGLWIVGRTLEDQTNHVTFFKRTEKKWEVMARLGNGSEIEDIVMWVSDFCRQSQLSLLTRCEMNRRTEAEESNAYGPFPKQALMDDDC